ncbi:MAG: DUF1540 domain-containing protein [Clostridiales bacterium]|nr:DUF1540 domain-containing protein [Clostridiales bacterium]
MKNDKMGGPINRVKCIVNTCTYYMAGDQCCADSIEVQTKNAKSVKETDCATFTMK